MVKDPQLYRLIDSSLLLETDEGISFCELCKNPVYDKAKYGRNQELRQQAKRRWIVLTDRMYQVTGPDGERQVCAFCFKRCGFQTAAVENGE